MQKLLFLVSIVFLFSACSVLDFPARFLGYSTQKFEREDASRYKQDFETNKRDAFDRTLLIIKALYARPTHQSFKKGYIVAFDFAKSFNYTLDSTEAGFFIDQKSETQVEITVVSNNSLLTRQLAETFFEMFASTDTFIPPPEPDPLPQENPLDEFER
ncbi:MAG: hypothetical protein LBB93_01285 [Elusimicrobiota bacterium]|jgi:hypothetical protein|nr:hypothetical protein [Elusimicrobiota bacterium]